ncbi:PilZ domain-containing protein, partial [Acinetobacter baumannii]
RVTTALPVRVRTADGVETGGVTVDLSEGGTAIRLDAAPVLPVEAVVDIALAPERDRVWTPARVVHAHDGVHALEFVQPMGIDQERQLV